MKKFTFFTLLTLFAGLQLAGCGGGGGEPPRQQKTAILTFGVISTATLSSVPINGILVTAKLPEGVTVATDPTNPRQLVTGVNGLMGLNDVQVAFGRYSANSREVIFTATNATNTTKINFGDFASLNCSVNPGFTLSEQNFKNPVYKVSGFDPTAAVNLVDLSSKTNPTLKVDFGF